MTRRYRQLYGVALDLLDSMGYDVAEPGVAGLPDAFARWWEHSLKNVNPKQEEPHGR